MPNRSKYHPQILIVEDESLISELIKRILENEDHWRPTAVNCGEHAIEAWDKGAFDVILMDCRMPGIDGFEATKHIRELERRSGRKHTPIIAFTVLDTVEIRQKCKEVGMDDFIAKPYNIKDIIETIYRHLPSQD